MIKPCQLVGVRWLVRRALLHPLDHNITTERTTIRD
jgi:hypothetical protein